MLWGVFFIASGLLLCFAGRKLIKPSVCVAGTFSTITLALILFYAIFLSKNTKTWVFWVVLVVSIVVGIVVGLILSKFIKLGAAILAGWGGFALGLLINNALLSQAQ